MCDLILLYLQAIVLYLDHIIRDWCLIKYSIFLNQWHSREFPMGGDIRSNIIHINMKCRGNTKNTNRGLREESPPKLFISIITVISARVCNV